MYRNEVEAEAWEPIVFHPYNTCPRCHGHHLMLAEYESVLITLDINARPKDYESVGGTSVIMCPECGYKGDVGKDFIQYPENEYRYCRGHVEEHRRICAAEIMKMRPRYMAGLTDDHNPLCREEGEEL